ncbi:BQ5605_C002g01616 [Microbotryum silenes-dioicae]|uniref:BQ5605_C002g01616 protein n=1 Tax=Microbotryum silenes-dioicae TaxID=796604 RepID=A0A2X0LZ78_9BASI|nr:BQ5605_C002g01616 [Microbotryum silenes-dioicae]
MVVPSIDPHPLSAVAKGWVIPDEDVDSRRALRQAKRASLSLSSPPPPPSSCTPLDLAGVVPATSAAHHSPFGACLGAHPDEEKGRSLRSSSGTLLFAKSTWQSPLIQHDFACASTPVAIVGLGDDEEEGGWTDAWIADRGIKSEVVFSKANMPSIVGPAKFDWIVVLATAVDTANGNLDLSNRGIAFVPDSVWELKTLRRLPQPLPKSTSTGIMFSESSLLLGAGSTCSFSRTQSVPATTPNMFGSKGCTIAMGTRSFARSSTVSFGRTPSEQNSRSSPLSFSVPLKLNLTHNELTASSLSNSLFTLPNLEQLFLGQNRLDRIPAGIGRLSGLVTLSLRSNKLRYLPAEILKLENLEQITLHPNPFMPPPVTSKDKKSSDRVDDTDSKRVLGPLRVHFAVPSLIETMTRYLLSPSSAPTPSQPNPPLRISLWERPTNFPDSLVEPFLSTPFPTSCVSRRARTVSGTSTDSSWSVASTVDDGATVSTQPFDPFANVCQSPVHDGEAKVFFRPAVERYEWVAEGTFLKPSLKRVDGAKTIPILHRGCGRTCLDWLEDRENLSS